MLRLRDIVAALAVVVLTRVAYDDPTDSLSATVQLSYYVGREDTTGAAAASSSGGSDKTPTPNKVHRLALAPVVFDVDGDGTVEALASVIHDQEDDTWRLEVLDLKPATSTDKTHMAPFRPKSLYQSDVMDFQLVGLNTSSSRPLVPVHMVTGHVPLDNNKKTNSGAATAPVLTKTHFKDIELTERNRKYFCGIDWHHASQSCSTPCPGGLMTECPDGQQCYADTSCDIESLHKKYSKNKDAASFSINDLLVTPAGGLPSIFSFWSNGVLAMHSLTGDYPSNLTDTIKKSKMKELLRIRNMWQVQVLDQKKHIVPYEWTGVSLTYVDATDAGDTTNGGMVVVQADLLHYDGDNDEEFYEHIMVAYEAETGQLLWDSTLNPKDGTAAAEADETTPVLLPVIPNSVFSWARRRSLKPYVHDEKKSGGASSGEGMVANCMHAYRRSLLTSGILPYMYWGEADTADYAVHFEQQQHNQHAILHHHSKKKDKSGSSKGPPSTTAGEGEGGKEQNWKSALTPFQRRRRANAHHHHSSHQAAKRGKPNVIVSKSERGLKVRSLKNGRPVCHLSLWFDTLYTDINNDGVLDAIFAITGNHAITENDDKSEKSDDIKWIDKVATRLRDARLLADNNKKEGEKKEEAGDDTVYQKLCHVMAFSGIPTKEELFTVNICGGKSGTELPGFPEVAPLLAVESIHGNGKRGQDIIVAKNDKTVRRLGGKKGRLIWEINGGRYGEDFPTWDDGDMAMVARIEVPNVLKASRPILIAGDQSVALLSPRHGGVLATAAFPQPSIRQPILVDFNGDGTTDIIVLTQEAIWGYRVTVHTGSSIFFRIAVGLIAMGLMLAVLRNRFGPYPGKRSTDA